MSHRYQVIIQGTGFSAGPDADGDGIVGFFATRRVLADTREKAYWTAKKVLEGEWKFQWLVESTLQHTGCQPRYTFELKNIAYLSWWRWHFTRSWLNYAFYSEAEEHIHAKA